MAAPSKIKGIVALSGSLMDETKKLKTDANQLKKLALFIAHGKSDQVIALEECRKVDLFFREKHIPKLTSVIYEMQHNICEAELNDVKAWLTRTLNEKSETLTK
jgi:phospholipase/carboxylesterase